MARLLLAAAACAAASAAAEEALSASAPAPAAAPGACGGVDRPQYLALNFDFDPGVPSSFSPAAVSGMLAALNGTRGGSRRCLAISFDFWTQYDSSDPAVLANSTDALLALADEFSLPLAISVDATQWWTTRPDLFNWWDPAAPGFDPANVANVEWSAPTPLNATSISWRNWGSQFRMPTPAPNFASPAFRAAAAASMAPVASRIAAWYAALPADRKWLLGYVRATQELWVGTNYFWYPGGNLPNGTPAWPPARDPTAGPAASAQLGYAAVCASGAACGAPITVAALDAAVASFVAFAAGVLADAGIPRSRIMAHTGSFFGAPPTPALVFNSPAAAVTAAAAPGWSMYNGAATHVGGNAGVAAALAAVDGTPWGAPEFNPFLGGAAHGTPAQWAAAFDDAFAFMNCRLLVLQNWNSIYPSNPAGQAGVVAALLAQPACLVDAAASLAAAAVNATAFSLSFALSADTDAAVVYAGAVGSPLLPSGRLAAPAVAIPVGPGASAVVVPVSAVGGAGGPGGPPVYWQVVATGCAAAQTVVTDVQAYAVAGR
jgi:hypothetical protein